MMGTETDNLALDLAFARQWAEKRPREPWEHYIETTERKLIDMRTPAPKPIPAPEPTDAAGAGLDPREAGKCGCGRPSPHAGRCVWKRAQEKNGGGQKRKAIVRKVRADDDELETPEVVGTQPAGLVNAVAADPTATLTFRVVAVRGDDRVEISGSSPALFLKAVDLISALG